MNKNKMYRQGDVLIMPVKNIPKSLVPTKRVTLALGEVTGHHHSIANGAIGYADNETALADYFEVQNESADLTHQEHDTISLPKGKYRKVIQVEYTPEAIRNVADWAIWKTSLEKQFGIIYKSLFFVCADQIHETV